MRGVAPYYVPSRGSVSTSAWEWYADPTWEPLPAFIEEWDYRTVVKLRCDVTVDLQRVRSSTGLHDGSLLFWSLGWRAEDSKLVRTPEVIEVEEGATVLHLELPADGAGSTVCVTRRLVLGSNRMHAAVGEARWAGSILWEDETSLRLTGRGAAFPTEVVDFESLGRDSRTSWYLELPLSPDVAAMGSFLLLINARDSALVAAVSAGRRTSEINRLLSDHLFEGVVEEIVRWALQHWHELQHCEEDSAGGSARLLTKRILDQPELWIGEDLDSMALKSAVMAGARSIGFGRRLT